MDPADPDELNARLVDAYRDYAFALAVERKAKAAALEAAFSQGLNSSKASDCALVATVDEYIDTVRLAYEIKALEQEYRHNAGPS